MTASPSSPSARANATFRADLKRVLLRTDRLFGWLLVGQWVFAVGVALVWSPRTWIAQYWGVHQHVVAAAVLGGLFAAYPLYRIRRHPGAPLTRHVIAIGQMLQSALLVHVTGGRIETHFHVFGSLALLAFYRDWRVLLTGSAVVYVDHLALGLWFPLSVYGVPAATVWRAVEHAFWVGFEVIFLVMACRTGLRELRAMAERQTAVEAANQGLEARVAERTKDLSATNEQLQAKFKEVEFFNHIMMGREDRIIELKEEINGLLKELGRDRKYQVGPVAAPSVPADH
jgi:hypothetical protein